jgi:hypothetical protein
VRLRPLAVKITAETEPLASHEQAPISRRSVPLRVDQVAPITVLKSGFAGGVV